MPVLNVVNVDHVRTSSPQEIETASKHRGHPRATIETDEEGDTASYGHPLARNGMTLTVPKNEEESTEKKSTAPARVTRTDPVPTSSATEHLGSTSQRPETSTRDGFWKRTQNDRNAIETYIVDKKGVSKDGTATGKARLIAKQDRFAQLSLWYDEKLNQLEKRKGKVTGSARSLFPQFYNKIDEDVWLRRTFSAWLDGAEEGKINKPDIARSNANYPTPLTQLGRHYDDQDQDDEEMVIKPEPEDEDDEEDYRTTFYNNNNRNLTFGCAVPQRTAAIQASAHGKMRDPSTPNSDKAYFTHHHHHIKRRREREPSTPDSDDKTHAIKRRREATTSERDEDSPSSSSEETFAVEQPPKKEKFWAVGGINAHFNGAKITPQKLEGKIPGGKVVKVVRRAWVWDENGRMKVYPPF
ncbi:uncharacterized protein MYCFIDRAFT_84186 [Pseudocercospora fijiensis CIRAD86]|uniref:Uncharacterized protein n=1 Tax=Pseudocercospora fijiensis (strain CIRAD86) TaxID=383855 RepID=N1Q8I6_PSEFD|nr:uncharacterized protein MYCFIDRAFT_84186 [Pseudocercospora fijiensis CIRAD86]EME87237.1 hypothetical protein MYCFIDRAFT_84186 [Pseudocercospora fijiensis CIRAD86]